MAEWQINKSQGRCFGTEKEIAPGEEYYAALVETAEGLERQDFAVDYWESEEPKVYCYWKSRLASPDKKKRIFVDDEMLMAFFERLEKESELEKINFRFVLMLILMRKRRLKYESSDIEDGKEMWVLRVVGDKELVKVENPHLDEDKIEELTSQLGQILQTDL